MTKLILCFQLLTRVAVVALLLLVVGISGCGDDAASELSKQEQLRQARREGARDARLRQLEREVRAQKHAQGAAPAAASGSDSPSSQSSTQSGSSDSWPAGKSGWTVVLASASSRAEATRVADRAIDAGLAQAGVLFSSNYSSLNRGYWVAYTGVLDKAAAQQRQGEARSKGFDDAYARYISP